MSSQLQAIISAERLEKYLKAGGFKIDRALDLYAWNMKLSAAFVPLFSAAEICLRNLMVARISEVFGTNWWENSEFLLLLGGKGKGIVKRAENKILKKNNPLDSGRMTAELSFGFWGNMLLPKYSEALWSDMHIVFPDLSAGLDQVAMYDRCEEIRELRNRISHHEPIFTREITKDYATCLELIQWLSAVKAKWIKPHCEVMAVVRQRPNK